MGIQHKSDQIASPASGVVLDKLYKDAALTRYDVFVIDALDPQSWPKQATPTNSDQIIDISPAAGASATFTSSFPSFSGGFVHDGTATQAIILPASCQPAATSRGNIAMVWSYVFAVPSLIRKLFGWLRSGPTTGTWGAYSAGAASGLNIVVFNDGASSTITLPAAGLYLFAMGRVEDGAGGYKSRRRVIRASDGSVVNAGGAASGATAGQPSSAASSTIGGDGSFGNSAAQRFYRMRMVDVQTAAGVSSDAWFDGIVDGEFALNRARAEWLIP